MNYIIDLSIELLAFRSEYYIMKDNCIIFRFTNIQDMEQNIANPCTQFGRTCSGQVFRIFKVAIYYRCFVLVVDVKNRNLAPCTILLFGDYCIGVNNQKSDRW